MESEDCIGSSLHGVFYEGHQNRDASPWGTARRALPSLDRYLDDLDRLVLASGDKLFLPYVDPHTCTNPSNIMRSVHRGKQKDNYLEGSDLAIECYVEWKVTIPTEDPTAAMSRAPLQSACST